MRKYLHNKNWDKSKSILYPLVHAKGVTWRNVINPDEIVNGYGADALRID